MTDGRDVRPPKRPTRGRLVAATAVGVGAAVLAMYPKLWVGGASDRRVALMAWWLTAAALAGVAVALAWPAVRGAATATQPRALRLVAIAASLGAASYVVGAALPLLILAWVAEARG